MKQQVLVAALASSWTAFVFWLGWWVALRHGRPGRGAEITSLRGALAEAEKAREYAVRCLVQEMEKNKEGA